jgi:hypothetical protein
MPTVGELELRIVGVESAIGDLNKVIARIDALEANFKKRSEEASGIINELIAKEKQLTEARNKATSIQDIANYNRQLNETQRQLNVLTGETKKSADRMTEMFKKVGTAIAAAFSIQAIWSFAKESFKAYEEQKKQERLLLIALNNRKDAQEELILQASALQKKVGIDDEQIMQIQRLAAQHKLSTLQIKELTRAALDMGAALGIDATDAAQKLLASYEGVTRGLPRLDAQFGKFSETALANGAAVDYAAKKWANAAEQAKTTAMEFQVAWDELRESVGGDLSSIAVGASKAGMGAMSLVYDQTLLNFENHREKISEMTDKQLLKAKSDYEKMVGILQKAGRTEDAAIYNAYIAQVNTRLQLNRQLTNEKKKALNDAAILRQAETLEIQKMTDAELENAKAEEDISSSRMKIINKEIALREKKKQQDDKAKDALQKRLDFEKQYRDFVSDMTNNMAIAAAKGDPMAELIANQAKELDEFDRQVEEMAKNAKKTGSKVSMEVFEGMRDALISKQKNEKFQLSTEIFGVWDMSNVDKKLEGLAEKFVPTATNAFKKELIANKENAMSNFDIFLANTLGIAPDTPEGKKELEEKKKALTDWASSLTSSMNEIFASRIEQQQTLIAGIDEEISVAEEALNKKKELAERGVRVDTSAEEKRLKTLKAQKEKALADEVKLKKQQFILDTLTQASNLITATSEIWSAFGYLPPLAIAMTALMFGSFAEAKIQAGKAAGIFEEGGKIEGERLNGRRHADGGIMVEAEGGEWILNRGSSDKYDGLLHAINEDDQRLMALELNRLAPTNRVLNQLVNAKMKTAINATVGMSGMSERLRSIEIILSQQLHYFRNKEETVQIGNKVITKRGNQTIVTNAK